MSAATQAGAVKKKKKKYQGRIYVDRERCKGCGFCVEFCPFGALELETDYNAKGYHPPFLAHEDKCNGCDLCGLYCPDFAIFSEKIRVED